MRQDEEVKDLIRDIADRKSIEIGGAEAVPVIFK